MSRDKTGPDFVEALARGLDVIKAFGPLQRPLSLTEVAGETGLARATARRILLTLEQLGYVRSTPAGFLLAPRVLELGVAYTLSAGLWEIAQPHLRELVTATDQAASVAQLDGADVLYVARVAVPKVVATVINVGTRFPARSTALGKTLLSALGPDDLAAALATPSGSSTSAFRERPIGNLDDELREIRSRGWAATNEEMSPGVRSIAAPIRDGDGEVIAAVNVSALVAEVPRDRMIEEFLPLLLVAASEIGRDYALVRNAPQEVVRARSAAR
ncbi:IclR family transcriptional regulator C-terminal domain-containing protein [Actinomadura meridiana]|uniref:IclR family transcriptional regulator C-terminal domain-containing protein n=1 Tax=Actinomadura meridiana TaxID=559626 RepID=A0ABP8C0V3_9ACTN